ncbi:MAG: metallophosphoesterase [Acetobacteraceae bacterium]|nr:metallophosphoesterase [Acetobacteraceae bacterium]
MRSLALAARGFVLAGLMAPLAARADNIVARWIQLGPGSSSTALAAGQYGEQPLSTTPTVLARAVINDGVCPSVVLDGSLTLAMKVRFTGGELANTPGTAGYTNANAGGYPQYFVSAGATAPGTFPDGTAKATTAWGECEAVVPGGHTIATIGGVDLKLPVANPQRILILADTGCRMAKANQQNCHDPAGFPFAALANYEAQFKPDLIIHVGDYFYRDTSCIVPAAGGVPAHEYVAGCSDATNANYEPWGDTFDSWNADVLYPGATLLASAPWVMTRGNHESCGRGARGWYALLDGRPFDPSLAACAGGAGSAPVGSGAVYSGDFEPTYYVPMGRTGLLVHDSSYANDSAIDLNMAKNYDYDLTAALGAVSSAVPSLFYVTHKPPYGLVSGAPNNGGDFTEQATFNGGVNANSAFSGGVPMQVAMFLSGHIHQFEYVNFADYTKFAPQMIVGVGGDNLDATANPNDPTNPIYAYQNQGFTVHSTSGSATAQVSHAYSQAEFGFAVLQASSTGYLASVYNIGASRAGRCTITLSPRNIACWQ